MEDIAIEINNVSKVYKLYDKPIDRLKETISLTKKSYHKDFYALNSINLKIKKGETVGIIGKNGAGKSTLLKIITGVLTPTSGDVKVYGRISSLLELGAGFNPEYTGMENIYLNGTVMGMTKEEVDERLQDVLDFADIGDFINQPVKTYSSGMYVRLAFSVAINVNPDILIVDEALAVGDARFQAKCYQKLEVLKDHGVTILFVSHDINTVKSICNRAYLIDAGCILEQGDPKDVCIKYFSLIFPNNVPNTSVIPKVSNDIKSENIILISDKKAIKNFGCGGVEIDSIGFKGINFQNVLGGEYVELNVKFYYDSLIVNSKRLSENVQDNFISGISISNLKGEYLFGMTTYDKGVNLPIKQNGFYNVKYEFYFPYLTSGEYLLNSAVALGTQENHIQLKWIEGIEVLKVNSCKKYVYGLFYNDYKVKGE